MSRVILITGANSGVGLGTAKVLATDPKNHVIIGCRSIDKGRAAIAEIKSEDNVQGTLSITQIDITDQSSVDAAVKQIEQEFGKLDVLLNNAGIAVQGQDIKTELEQTLAVNVVAQAVNTRAFYPLLSKAIKPYILYVSSTMGSMTVCEESGDQLHMLGYRVSKAALNMLALEESIMFKKDNIKVFSVCPGLVESNLRGTSTEARTSGGQAGDSKKSGLLFRDIINGEWDAHVGKFINQDGVCPW